MSQMALDSSSDEDDPYTNSVARLRALKKQRFERETLSPTNVEQQTNGKEINGEHLNGKEINGKGIKGEELNGKGINAEDMYAEDMNVKEMSDDGIQTRSRTVRRNIRRNNGITTRGRRTRGRGRGRRLPIGLERGVEFARGEIPKLTVESCKDNIIALSDDDKEDDNYEMNIKVYWRSNRIDRLSMRRHDSFKGIFEYYADLEKVSVNEVLIMKKDQIINPTDTPASLKLSIIDILDGGIVHPGMNTLTQDDSNDEDICTIKVQTANKKQSLTIPLKKDEQFKRLFANCAEQLNVKEEDLKFYFDGEQISPTDTPESLDLEGEACVDLHIST
ncbi:DNA repair protein Rad60 isoform X1 [Temnothorax longispinosus]|uniref:DNA repair protein Rad60 isoform X1 n=1 Tax=Temnothorax longispinosus TaxID=300112 RepID=UPI003A98CF01